MAFTLPSFNLAVTVYAPGTVPPLVVGIGATVGQLYLQSRQPVPLQAGAPAVQTPILWLRLPLGAKLALGAGLGVGSFFKIASGALPAQFYKARWWERIHMGMPNEYLAFNVEQCDIMGVTPDPTR